MFSSITTAQIKSKARIEGDQYDQDIQDLIDEMDLVVQNRLSDNIDLTDNRIKATLELGFKEIVAGMFLQILANESSGWSFTAGIVQIDESKGFLERAKRGLELEEKGWGRLEPYLKSDDPFAFGVM